MSLSESEVDAIDRWVHPAALGRLCDEVEQIVARHVTAALTEAADFIRDTTGIGKSVGDFGEGWYAALDYAIGELKNRASP